MKRLFILTFLLPLSTLTAQVRLPVVHPPVSDHPNIAPPNPDVPPAPNPPNPYNPYGSTDGKEGSAFSEANSAAMHFLNIMDNHIYQGAWLDAGGIVRDVVSQEVWTAGMHATRTHLGVVKARKVLSHRIAKALHGGLHGDFMIIEYETEFANRPNAIERVTLMMHAPLGLWKVTGYHITNRRSIGRECPY